MTWFLLLMLMGDRPGTVDVLEIQIEIPALEVSPYHRPYVAIWLEDEARNGVKTIAVWHEGAEWLKDMRQWWRRLGRDGEPPYDGVSGATRRPGRYVVSWRNDLALPAGTYYLNVEAAREQGGRDYLRQKIEIGSGRGQRYEAKGDLELKTVTILVNGGPDE